jgi:pyrroline-5-carboxylate reductase
MAGKEFFMAKIGFIGAGNMAEAIFNILCEK